jgi:hypothetical protein
MMDDEQDPNYKEYLRECALDYDLWLAGYDAWLYDHPEHAERERQRAAAQAAPPAKRGRPKRAMVAAELANLPQGVRKDLVVDTANAASPTSQSEAADTMKVSHAAVQRAAKVKKKSPKLAALRKPKKVTSLPLTFDTTRIALCSRLDSNTNIAFAPAVRISRT